MSCPKCAVARVKECLPSSLSLLVGVTCHKKQISRARVAYFPFDFQWFSCECFPLLTLEFRQFWLRRVVDIYAKHIDACHTWACLTCACVCVCMCVCVCVFGMQRHRLQSLSGNISLYDVIEYLSTTQYNLEVTPLHSLLPPRLLASLMYELHVASRTCGSKRNFGIFHKNLQKYFSLNFGHKFPTGDWSAEFGCPLWQRLDKRFNYYQPDGGIEGRGGDPPSQVNCAKGARAGDSSWNSQVFK